MNEEDWLTFYETANEIEQRSGVSRAVARKRLRQACADQLITTLKAPYDEQAGLMPIEFWSPIAPSEWRQREVDYDGPDKDGCPTVVMIREGDYRHWLNAASDVRRNKGSPKRDLARQAVEEIWPDAIIPKEVSNWQIERQVADRLKQQGRSDIGRDTILRAAGRKK
jgi:hypothetical protein